MKIIFFGTPSYVLPILEALHKNFKEGHISPIVAVVTQAPKPVGRKQFLKYSPIDDWAHKRHIPIFFDCKEILESKIEADVGILASFAQIIPKDVLEYFPKGILNVHPSLLPKYRGSSPIQAALISGDTTSGVSIIKLDEKLDHGPIVTQFKEEIVPNDTQISLRNRLFEKSAQILIDALPAYFKRKINLVPQDESYATYSREIKRDDGYLEPSIISSLVKGVVSSDAIEVKFIKDLRIDANTKNVEKFTTTLSPWPGVWTQVKLNPGDPDFKRLKILNAHSEGEKLILDQVQLEGKNQVSFKQFCEGYPKNSLSTFF